LKEQGTIARIEAQKEIPHDVPQTGLGRKNRSFLVVMVGLLVSFAAGRRVGAAVLEAQLGSRFLTTLPQVMKAGFTAEAVIVDPGKLALFGLANLKKGIRSG